MMRSGMSSSWRTRRTNQGPFSASRTAAVATAAIRGTPRRVLLGRADALVARAAGGRGAPGQPGLVLELVHDGESAGGVVLRHQQTYGVGSDVDGRDPLAPGRG